MKEFYKKIMIGLFALFMLAMPILTLVFLSPEKKPFSENENRYLAEFPKLSLDSYLNEKFMEGFDEWISDRFIWREDWIRIKNKTDEITGKTEINGVFIENDMMMQVWIGYDEAVLEKNIKAINKFVAGHPDIPSYFMLVPNAQEIYSDILPPFAEVGDQKEFVDMFYGRLEGFAGTVDAYSALEQNKDSYIYYRTDHHWTSYGAYLGYAAAGAQLGYSPVDVSNYTIEHASYDFRGTLFSKTLDKGITADIIDYYFLAENEPDVKVSVYDEYDVSTGKVTYNEYDSMYFREYLDVKDKYSSFLGQNSPIVTVESGNAKSDKSILVIKDSYAHSLVPFLTKEYSKVTMLDLRYINADFQMFVSLEDYDQILFLYNVITFSEDDRNIIKLNLAK